MNKIKTLLLTMFLVVISSVCASADTGVSYDLDEIGITVSVPESNGLVTYTRNTQISGNDGLVTDADSLLQSMEENNEYLRAIHTNNEYQVAVISKPTDFQDFTDLTEDGVISATNSGLDGFLDRKKVDGEIFVAKPMDIQFAAFNFYEEYSNGTVTNGYAYVTVTNERMYCFVLTMANERTMTDLHRSIIREMALNCIFKNGGTEEITTEQQVVSSACSETVSDENATSASDIMISIVSVVKIVVLVLLIVVVAIILRGILTNRKVEKEKPVQIGHTTKRAPQYENRLKRVMGDAPVSPTATDATPKNDSFDSDDDMLNL
ncbi:MAG: hypothetical protein IKN54_02425 [Lachnospiraceae bacterium]|nr:hypothetical protein [Lachnospiraceae bacterium]